LPSRHKHMDAWNPLASGLAPQMLADSKLSRSIYRGYDVTCVSSLELVERPCNCRGGSRYCLQLRSGSRRNVPFLAVPQKGKARFGAPQHDMETLDREGRF
jgi:hypothetical protein